MSSKWDWNRVIDTMKDNRHLIMRFLPWMFPSCGGIRLMSAASVLIAVALAIYTVYGWIYDALIPVMKVLGFIKEEFQIIVALILLALGFWGICLRWKHDLQDDGEECKHNLQCRQLRRFTAWNATQKDKVHCIRFHSRVYKKRKAETSFRFHPYNKLKKT